MAKYTTHARIHSAVRWYATLPADFQDINKLMEARRILAGLLFDYAIEVGELKREANRTEHVRKSKFARLVGEALAKSDGKNIGAATQTAESLTMHERGIEGVSDAEYYAGKLVLDAGKDVLDTLNQHISNLKNERRLEFTGQGSQ